MTVETQQFSYILLLQGYMFRLLIVIIRPYNEPTQDYLIPSALFQCMGYVTTTYLHSCLTLFFSRCNSTTDYLVWGKCH